MSSPWKQLERRLPALPGYSSQSVFSGNFSETITSIVSGPEPLARTQSTGGGGGTAGDITISAARYNTCTGILSTPREIKRYLRDNPWLVEEFIRENCTAEELQKWFQTDSKSTINRRDGRSKRPSSFREGNLLCPRQGEDIKSFLLDMVEKLEDQENIPDVLYRLSKIISSAVKADEVFLFMVGAQDDSLYMCSEIDDCVQLIPFARIESGTTIAAHVAHSNKPVLSQDILGDERFPNGTGRDGSLAKSVLCLPLIQPNGEIVAVIEFSRHIGHSPLSDTERQIAATFLTWVGIALDKVQVCNGLMKQREFNDFLLEVTSVIFDDIISIDTLRKHIMMFAKSLVNADRCALFMVDNEAQELFADLFDEGVDDDGNAVFVKRNQIRFSMDKGIAGHVARTGEVVNIADAYQDPRFNREVDVHTGYATRCVLCMPITSHGIVIGVVQLINKIATDEQNSVFDVTDESNFKMFSTYCALALHYSKIYSANQQCEQRLAVAKEQLTYYTSCNEQQVDRLITSWTNETFLIPPEFEKCEFHSRPYITALCELFIHMVHTLFGPTTFDLRTLARFILTVRKNYRLVPFHNFCHAFDVAHAMYWLLLRSEGKFTEVEMMAMFFSCICHDIDHRGITNSYHTKFATPLGRMYESSVMERHHYQLTMDILQREGHNIFSFLPEESFKQLTSIIHELIMSTDLALFFSNHKELSKLIIAQSLDWTNEKHRSSIRSILMTTCDLCATTKLWPTQVEIVECLYDEFYKQGDEEKERGEVPITMLDRDNLPHLPQEQVDFLSNICIPCFSTLVDIIPEAAPLLSGCKDNLLQWKLEVEGKRTAMWNVESSRVSKD